MSSEVKSSKARQGKARQGKARKERHGKARQTERTMVLPLFVRLHSRHVFLCNFSCGATSAILIGQVQSTEDTSSVVTLIASWCVNETRRYEGSLSLHIAPKKILVSK
jgi:hypothetical protein